jgi:hypothetical protein
LEEWRVHPTSRALHTIGSRGREGSAGREALEGKEGTEGRPPDKAFIYTNLHIIKPYNLIIRYLLKNYFYKLIYLYIMVISSNKK